MKSKWKPPKKNPAMAQEDLSPAQLAADSHYHKFYHAAPHEERITIVRTIRELLEKSPNGRITKKEVNTIIRDITGKDFDDTDKRDEDGTEVLSD